MGDKAHVNFNVNGNINQPKFGVVKNDYFISDVNWAQVIENKAQSNFGLNENINGLKNQPAKNGDFSNLLIFERVQKARLIPRLICMMHNARG